MCKILVLNSELWRILDHKIFKLIEFIRMYIHVYVLCFNKKIIPFSLLMMNVEVIWERHEKRIKMGHW